MMKNFLFAILILFLVNTDVLSKELDIESECEDITNNYIEYGFISLDNIVDHPSYEPNRKKILLCSVPTEYRNVLKTVLFIVNVDEFLDHPKLKFTVIW